MSYTKGKWFVEESYSIDAIAMLGKFNVQREVGVRRAGSYDDAKRIVDCVNACDGMDNPDDEISKLRRERNALLASSKDLMDFIMHPTIEADETIPELINMQKAIDLAGELWAK